MLAFVRTILWRLRHLAHARKLEVMLNKELEFHLQTEIEEQQRRGKDPEEARRLALIALGGLEETREQCRDTRGFRRLAELPQDLRYGMRSLRNAPGFAVTAILTVAIGIGATTSTFSIVDGILFRPLPYKEPDRLVRLIQWQPKTALRSMVMPKEAFVQFSSSRMLESVAACGLNRWPAWLTFTGGESPEVLRGEQISMEFLPLLGIQPLLGRVFRREDTNASPPVAILLHGTWQSRFASDKSIIGRTVTFAEGARTIVGVMPPEFRFPAETPAEAPQVLLPMPAQWTLPVCTLIGRLKPEVTIDQSQAEADVLTGRIFKDPKNTAIRISPLKRIEWVDRSTLLMLVGAVCLLVLIACINVANLLTARNATRQRELAIRAAIGAGRARLVRQLLTESLFLSAIGGLLGVLVADLTKNILLEQLPAFFRPMAEDIVINGRVLVFSAAMTLAAGIFFGLSPALHASAGDLNAALKHVVERDFRAHAHWRVKGGLLAVEVALAFVLLTGSGLLLNSFVRLHTTDLGFDLTNVWIVNPRPSQVARFRNEAIAKLRTVGGIQSFAAGEALPFSGQELVIRRVSPGYFETLAMPCLSGRLFGPQDERGKLLVAVVNESYVKNYFPQETPLGKVIQIDKGTKVHVVGIVRDARSEVRKPAGPILYVPYDPSYQGAGFFFVKVIPGGLDPASWLKEQFASVDRTTPLKIEKLEQTLGDSISYTTFFALILGIFAAIGMILITVGIAGLTIQNVAHRRHEIGVRLALGAESGRVVAMVTRQILAPVALGLVIGIAGALALTRVLASLLYEIKPRDARTFLFVSAVMLLVTLVSAYLPARRASWIDPIETLRCE